MGPTSTGPGATVPAATSRMLLGWPAMGPGAGTCTTTDNAATSTGTSPVYPTAAGTGPGTGEETEWYESMADDHPVGHCDVHDRGSDRMRLLCVYNEAVGIDHGDQMDACTDGVAVPDDWHRIVWSVPKKTITIIYLF